MMLSLGAGCRVLASEVVAISERVSYFSAKGEGVTYLLPPWAEPPPRASVVLRGGLVLPAYVRVETLRKRWQEALA